MKCRLLVLLVFLGVAQHVSSQESRLRKRYISFGYSDFELKLKGVETLKSGPGLFFTVGKSYFLHKEPVERMLRFGIDAT